MIAIAGGKGGCGKTTTALGIARAMARRGRRPLVVDCDCDMPDLHHQSGIDTVGGIDELADGGSIERVTVDSTRVPGVRVLTAGDRKHVDEALRRAVDWQGPVLLDSPPGMGPDAARPLRHADRSVLVSTDQPPAVADTQVTAESARRLGAPPIALVVREESTATTDDCELLTELSRMRVPTVSDPFDHPQTERAWAKTVRNLSDLGLGRC